MVRRARLGTSWLVQFGGDDPPPLRLFCFPCAGMAASMYRPWAPILAATAEVIGVQPPGRETRFQEPAYRRLAPLADAVALAIRPWVDRPFAFFGHSLGGLLAFEVARRLQLSAGVEPVHLFVSARRAPWLPARRPPLSPLDDQAFVTEVQRRFRAIPEEMLRQPDLLAALLPVLRADVEAVESYEPLAGPVVPWPISCFGGRQDEEAIPTELEAWKAQTSGGFALHLYPGGHFFLHEQRAEVLRQIRGALETSAARIAPIGSAEDRVTL